MHIRLTALVFVHPLEENEEDRDRLPGKSVDREGEDDGLTRMNGGGKPGYIRASRGMFLSMSCVGTCCVQWSLNSHTRISLRSNLAAVRGLHFLE